MNFDKLTQYLDSVSETFGIPACDMKVTVGNDVVFRHMAGYRDAAGTERVREDDLYRIFSCTKVMTMFSVMQLIEQNKLGLYDKLSDYLPAFKIMRVSDEFDFRHPERMPKSTDRCHIAHNEIRIIDLMTMSAGMSYDVGSDVMQAFVAANPGADTQALVNAMAKMPLLYEPGTRMRYSLAHDVLAAVIEVVSGEKYSDYLRNHIFGPLGTTDFYFLLNEEQAKRMSQPYDADPRTGRKIPKEGLLTSALRFSDNFESGGGGMITTVDAYSKVVQAVANGGVGANGVRILSEESVRLFTNRYTFGQLQADFDLMQKPGCSYGLGVYVVTETEGLRTPAGAFGWDGAAGAYTMIDPFNKISITYMHHILGFPIVYTDEHPVIREMVYEALGF